MQWGIMIVLGLPTEVAFAIILIRITMKSWSQETICDKNTQVMDALDLNGWGYTDDGYMKRCHKKNTKIMHILAT